MTPRGLDELDADFAPARGPSVYTVEIDGEAVLLDEDANRFHYLTHTAALLWACFDGKTPLAQLAFEISEELALPADAVLADSIQVTRELGREGLLEGVGREHGEAG